MKLYGDNYCNNDSIDLYGLFIGGKIALLIVNSIISDPIILRIELFTFFAVDEDCRVYR